MLATKGVRGERERETEAGAFAKHRKRALFGRRDLEEGRIRMTEEPAPPKREVGGASTALRGE